MNFQRNSDNRIAILGGSFNPIHYGHLAMAKAAYDSFHFANVLLMPNATTYYKENIPSIKDTDRLSMLDLVVKEYSYLSISILRLKEVALPIPLTRFVSWKKRCRIAKSTL